MSSSNGAAPAAVMDKQFLAGGKTLGITGAREWELPGEQLGSVWRKWRMLISPNL